MEPHDRRNAEDGPHSRLPKWSSHPAKPEGSAASALALAAGSPPSGRAPGFYFEARLEDLHPRVLVDVDCREDARRLICWLFSGSVAQRIFAELDAALEEAAR